MLVPLSLLSIPVAGWIVVRAMEHTERMEMIRRGMAPPPYVRNVAAAGVAMASIVLLAIAYLMALAAIALPLLAGQPPPASWAGTLLLVFIAAGIAPFVMRRRKKKHRGRLRVLDADENEIKTITCR